MFCGAWVYFRLILACRKENKQKTKETPQKRQFPPAPGGIAGLVGYPTFSFIGYNDFGRRFVVLL
jgi:hypothetical protein